MVSREEKRRLFPKGVMLDYSGRNLSLAYSKIIFIVKSDGTLLNLIIWRRKMVILGGKMAKKAEIPAQWEEFSLTAIPR